MSLLYRMAFGWIFCGVVGYWLTVRRIGRPPAEIKWSVWAVMVVFGPIPYLLLKCMDLLTGLITPPSRSQVVPGRLHIPIPEVMDGCRLE